MTDEQLIADLRTGFSRDGGWFLIREETVERAIAALSALPSTQADDEVREALTKCRDKFAEYVKMHKAKLHDGTPTAEWLSIRQKVERNEEMVALCDAALAKVKPNE